MLNSPGDKKAIPNYLELFQKGQLKLDRDPLRLPEVSKLTEVKYTDALLGYFREQEVIKDDQDIQDLEIEIFDKIDNKEQTKEHHRQILINHIKTSLDFLAKHINDDELHNILKEDQNLKPLRDNLETVASEDKFHHQLDSFVKAFEDQRSYLNEKVINLIFEKIFMKADSNVLPEVPPQIRSELKGILDGIEFSVSEEAAELSRIKKDYISLYERLLSVHASQQDARDEYKELAQQQLHLERIHCTQNFYRLIQKQVKFKSLFTGAAQSNIKATLEMINTLGQLKVQGLNELDASCNRLFIKALDDKRIKNLHFFLHRWK